MKLHDILADEMLRLSRIASVAASKINAPRVYLEHVRLVQERESALTHAADCQRILAEIPDREFDGWGELQFRACLAKIYSFRHDSAKHADELQSLIKALHDTVPVAA